MDPSVPIRRRGEGPIGVPLNLKIKYLLLESNSFRTSNFSYRFFNQRNGRKKKSKSNIPKVSCGNCTKFVLMDKNENINTILPLSFIKIMSFSSRFYSTHQSRVRLVKCQTVNISKFHHKIPTRNFDGIGKKVVKKKVAWLFRLKVGSVSLRIRMNIPKARLIHFWSSPVPTHCSDRY